jgi:dihydrofolate reductase
MRKLSINTFVTLDGVMQAPGAPEEDPTGGFTHGGWSVNYWDDQMGQVMDEVMGKPFDLLLGRKTYEIFAAHWPHAGDQAEWQNSQLLRGDVATAVAEIKRGDGPEIQVHGSGNLIQTLLQTDLIDELRLWIFPLILGDGKRVFERGAIPRGLELVDSLTSSTGVIIATFRRGSGIAYGSFAIEPPTKEEVARRQKLAKDTAH